MDHTYFDEVRDLDLQKVTHVGLKLEVYELVS